MKGYIVKAVEYSDELKHLEVYQAPKLTRFGGMATLTASGTGARNENSGADIKPDRQKV